MDENCIFCKIVKGEIPSKKVYENDKVVAFLDIAPQAPVHIILIPKEHIVQSLAQITPENSHIMAAMGEAVATIAREQALTDGFRVISNSGANAGQTVNHLHFHLLAGKSMGEKLV